MKNNLPISQDKEFKYSITFSSWDEESLEAGETNDIGFEVQEDSDTIGEILSLANERYGIYYPLSFGIWESTEPEEDKDFFEKGIRKYYTLHITNEDGTEISQEENDFITFLLSNGRYEIDKFSEYAIGGIVGGAIAVGVGLIAYYYFKNKKQKGKESITNSRAKSVERNGRKFPIKDAWKREHSKENKSEKYEVPQEDRFAMGGDASEHYHEVEYGQGGVARAKEVIMNKIGYNEETADYFVGKSEKFAIWLADSILKEEIKNRNYNKKQWLDSSYSSWRTINANYGGAIREILDWLQHPVTEKQELKQLSFEQALEKAREWHNELQVLGGDIDFTEPEKNTILKKYPKNDEGVEYYWVFIPSNYCDLESSRMGHCGRTGYGNNLISLRSVKPYGKGHTISDSHVTIAYGVTDGIFYQVKGKKNNKPAEKYFSFIYDLIKNSINDSINIDFNGFGSEYGDSEDYGFEDMSNEELREIYDLKPSLFNDVESIYVLFDNGVIDLDELTKITEKEPELFSSYGNQMKLYDLGVISEKPSTTFELNYSCDEVYKLLDVEGLRDDIVEKILCGDFEDLTDGWSYYYENPSDLVDNLNKENTDRVIDEIVRITGYEKSVVEENGIEYYLNGEDENFPTDDFDNIIRVLASAQNNADQSDYYNYLYKQLESSLEELGEVHSLNDEGVKMTIDLSKYMHDEEIAEAMDRYEFTDIADLFYEEIHNSYGGAIDRPSFNIDDRYSPYGSNEDFNSYVSDTDLEQGYEKGGSLRAKTNKKTKIKNMKPSQRKLASGGNVMLNTEVILTENRPNGEKYRGVVKPFMLKSIEENQYNGGFKRYEIDIYDDNIEREPTKEEIEKANDFFDKIGGRYSDGGRVTTNDGIIEAFLTSERELKVGNLSTHYNENDKEILLRNYGTLIAVRKGKNVEITNTKYSKTTTIITNKVKNMALKNRMNVKYVDKFADGGEASEWKIGDKFRVLKGIYGDYNSPRYANKEFEVINIRDGKYIDARTPKGTTETFDMKNIEKIKYADGGEAGKWVNYDKNHLINTETGMIVSKGTNLKDIKPKDIKGFEKLGMGRYAGGGSVEIDSKKRGVAKRTNIKKWYVKNYPDDELGEEINDKISFWTLYVLMYQRSEVYSLLEVSDSVVRERVFEKLAEILGVDYDYIYKLWLRADKYAGGGSADDDDDDSGEIQEELDELVQGFSEDEYKAFCYEHDIDEEDAQEMSDFIYSQTNNRCKEIIQEIEDGYYTGGYYEEDEEDKYAEGGRVTKYVAVYVVQGNYGQGWEDLTAHDNRKDARSEMRVYDDNESYPHRVIQRRVLRTDYEKGNYAEGGETGRYKYGIFTISENGEELGHTFYSNNPDLELDPYGDDVPVSIGSNQIVKLIDEYAEGGEAGDYYEQLAVYVQGVGSIYNGTSMKKAVEKANSYLKKNKNAEIVIVDEKYGDEYDLDGNMKDEYAVGGEVEDWMEEALESLIEETGFDDLEITHVASTEFICTDGKHEYRVFQTEEDAEETAIEQVREDLEEYPENFNQDWLMNYIDGRDFFEESIREMTNGYAEDIKSESDKRYANRLIAEMVEWGIMDEEEALSGNAEELADYYQDDFVNVLTEDKMNEGNDGLDYFINNFGEEETYKMVNENNLINIDKASEDAVNVDGIGHFLSSYDGETLYLSNDCVAYRTN